ncbi:MAG: hypothetical protein EXS10_03550 [Phycisphaerales bacterium]|nr:hypothetical protein [Phycisphaerales bacterium]
MMNMLRLYASAIASTLLIGCATAPRHAGLADFAQGLRVDRSAKCVEVDAEIAIDVGVLEAAACLHKTREHESLVVVRALPSALHAAMLLAGFEPGKPGVWSELFLPSRAFDRLELKPPSGALLAIDVRLADGTLVPLSSWIRSTDGARAFPLHPWVFAGSVFAPNPKSWKEPGEHYVADYTGQIIGIVTFGDEVIAFDEVLPDRVAFAEPDWEVDSTKIPPPGTPVILVIRAR